MKRKDIRKSTRRFLSRLLCTAMVLGSLCVSDDLGIYVRAAESVEISDGDTTLEPKQFKKADIASGKYENITWKIDADGKLTVEGTGEFSDSSWTNRAPWFSQRESIKSAEVHVTGMTNASYMFYACRNLTSVDVRGLDTSEVTDMDYMFCSLSKLTDLDVSGFDTSSVTSMNSMFNGCSSLTSLDVSDFDTSKVTNMRFMFKDCSGLTSLDVSRFDTGSVTDMGYMFSGCSGLTGLDVDGFDTGSVTYMENMFYNCRSLTSLDVGGFDTNNVTRMNNMFYDCRSLPSLNVSRFDTSNVTRMNEMFYNCSGLTSLDVSGFDTSGVTDIRQMFYNCRSLTGLDVSDFDTSKVTDAEGVFRGCRSLTSLDVSGFDTSNMTYISALFMDCASLTSLDVSNFDTSELTNLSSMFSGCNSLTSLDVSGFDTSRVARMDSMFSKCSSLTSLDVSGFDTSNVTWMTNMFSGCSGLTSLDVSGFDTSSVTDMGYMFSGCSGLTSLDVSGFDTGSVTKMNHMFGDESVGCSSLTSLDVSGFDTSSVKRMDNMFSNCNSLTSLDVSGFDTGSVTDMMWMFGNCSGLTNLDVSGFDTSSVTRMNGMFEGCSGLKSLDVSGFDTSGVTSMVQMFKECSGLTSLDVSGFDTSSVKGMGCMFGWCVNLRSLDVSAFDMSNVESMEGMFEGCIELESLDLSGFDTSSAKYMNGMFGACIKLAMLYTPYNVPILSSDYKAFMPNGAETVEKTDVWQDADGNTYTVLPVGLDHSIVLAKNKKPDDMQAKLTVRLAKTFYEKGSSIDTEDLTVVYRGADGRSVTLSPQGADNTVKGYTLSADDMNTSGEKTMTVSYNDGTNTLTETVGFTVSAPLDVTVTLPETDYVYKGKQHRPIPTVKPSSGDAEAPLRPIKDYTVSYQNNVDAGDATLTVTLKNAFSGTATKSFVIQKAPLTVIASDVNMVIGQFDALPDESTLTFNVTGLCGTHKAQDVFGTMPAVSYAVNGEKVDKSTIEVDREGKYDLILSGAVLNKTAGANYEITSYQNGKLTIAEKGDAEPSESESSSGSSEESGSSSESSGESESESSKESESTGESNESESPSESTNESESSSGSSNESENSSESSNESESSSGSANESESSSESSNESENSSESSNESESSSGSSNESESPSGSSNESESPSESSNESESPSEGSNESESSSGGSNESESSSESSNESESSSESSKESEPSSEPANGTGLHVTFPEGKIFTYTGSAIKPMIVVTNNNEELVEGTDYTVKYSNNTKAGTAKLTVTGKGRFTGKQDTTFTIEAKSLKDADIEVGDIIIAENTKAVPVIYYNGIKLGNKDYTLEGDTGKISADINNPSIKVIGKGNYQDEITVKIKVVAKEEMKKFSVTLGKEKLSYTGNPQQPLITLTDKSNPDKQFREGVDYKLVFNNNHTDAGTVKVTVIGMGEYSGSVTKSYKINPAKEDMTLEFNKSKKYVFSSAGTTVDNIKVKNAQGVELESGKDYKISYSANKKVGTGKINVTFLGNYKGSKAVKDTFEIEPAVLSNDTVSVVVSDKAYTGKKNAYKSAPIVTDKAGNVLKSSDYTVNYYNSSNMADENEIKGKNNLIELGENEDVKTVYVKVTGKGNYAGNTSVYATKDYKVKKTTEDVLDISKAKVTFKNDGTKVKKLEYTGLPLKPDVEVTVRVKGVGIITLDASQYDIIWTNNVNKGKATAVITGNGKEVDGYAFVGSKNATISITARNIKNVKNLFGEVNAANLLKSIFDYTEPE